MRKRMISFFLLLTFGLAGVLSAQEVLNFISSFADNDFIKDLKQKLTVYLDQSKPERLYLSTDKPFYKPSETLWFSVFLQNETSLKPMPEAEVVHVEWINPKGNVEKHLKIIAKNGLGNGEIELPEDIAGGMYKIKAYTNWQKNNENNLLFEKDIQIQTVILPKLKMKLDFVQKAYGAGDEVKASLDLQSLSNEALKNQNFKYILNLKGEKILEDKAMTDSDGKATISFKLPKDLDTSDGLLNVMIAYEGRTESISRSVPIVLSIIDLQFFPEGGDLVNNLSSRLAFQARNEFGKPADIEGVILDKKGSEVAKFASFHMGMGAVKFNPKSNEKYTAQITKPVGVKRIFELPEILERGFVLNANKEKDQIKVRILSTEQEEMSLVAQVRGKICYTNAIKIKTGENELDIDSQDFPMGVCQLTLFDKKGIERAERLVFVNENQQLNISIKTDKEKYLPREKVVLTVSVKDERGLPMSTNLSLAVVDDKLLSFADDKQGHILSKLLLEPDLKTEVEEANFYFDKTQEKATQALDYLLLTQGWRTFRWEKVLNGTAFQKKFDAEKIKEGVNGMVRSDNGNILAKAKITVNGTEKTVFSDSEGRFELGMLPDKSVITINASGHQIQELEVYNDEFYDLTLSEYLRQRIQEIAKGAGGGKNKRAKNGNDRMIEDVEREVVEMQVQEMPVPAPNPPAELKKEEVETKPVADVLEKIADKKIDDGFIQPEIADKKDLAKPKPIDVVGGIAFDDRMNDKIAIGGEENQPVQVSVPQFHRAKVFAVPNYSQKQNADIRTDFRSTIFWHGNLRTDSKGKATVEFYASDDITAFRAVAEGVGADGSVGHQETVFYTQLPFSMSIKVPAQVSIGDFLQIPLTLVNNTNQNLSGKLDLTLPKSWKSVTSVPEINLKGMESKTVYLDYEVLAILGKDQFVAKFESGQTKDAFSQEVNTVAKGFPVNISFSGDQLEQSFNFEIKSSMAGSLTANVTAFPSTLSDLLAGIEGMIREPYGCFEQTSSSTYPNIMVLRYLEENKYDNKTVLANAKNMIDKGYKRLVAYETAEKGYEWFGGTPAHEALTAYGLMEFRDMQGVYASVDPKMLDRTAEFLMNRKDGQGGFQKNPRALDSFGGASKEITDAYIVYSLIEAGFDGEKIRKELDQAYSIATKNQDPYQLALIANALLQLKDKKGNDLLKNLISKQKTDGSWEGASHSITRSTGQGLQIETTALVCLAILKSSEKALANLDKGIKFILASRSYGSFGNTQSTVLALKALTEYAKFSKRTSESGTIEVWIDGKKINEQKYAAGEQNAIEIKSLEKSLADGKHELKVKYVGVKNPLPYSVGITYNTTLPFSQKECAVKLQTKLLASKAKTGETVRLNTILQNSKNEGLPMTLAIIGIPAGLSPQAWQLKELQEKKVVDFYEIIGNNVVFYYRQMLPNEKREISLDLKAELGGKYEAQASCAYLYYTKEFKDWVAGEKIEIGK